MRIASRILVALPAIWVTGAHSQDTADEALRELYCEICPYDAPVRPERQFSPARSVTVITAEDMRSMGVTSVSEMINQLPPLRANIAGETDSTEPAEAAGSEAPNAAVDEESASPEEGADEVVD